MEGKIVWEKYGIEPPRGAASENVKAFCPECHDRRRDRRDKSLSCNLRTGAFKCHYCGWEGYALERTEEEIQAWRALRGFTNRNPLRFHKAQVRAAYKTPGAVGAAPGERALAWFRARGISPETVAKMRITEGPVKMPPDWEPRNTVQFNYYREGQLVNVKYRTGDKKFRLVQGAELLPYNLDAIRDTPECIVTEGEMDALSFIEAGRPDVVSVPNGAQTNLSFLDDYIDSHFEGKATIYIASDVDAKGVELRDELLRRFGADRCRVVLYGLGCKDANEHLVKYGPESLLECLEGAAEIPVGGVFSVRDFEPSLDALYQSGWPRGVTIGHPNFDALCSFETRRLCVLTGIPGCLGGETPVALHAGGHKPLRDVVPGDVVVTYNEARVRMPGLVSRRWECGVMLSGTLTLRGGQRIVCSHEHRFLTPHGWKPAQFLRSHDAVLLDREAAGQTAESRHPWVWAPVHSFKPGKRVEMFDIEVPGTHCYVAAGMVTHNSGKSEWLDEMAVRLNVRHGWKFAFFSPENAPLAYHASKLIEKITGRAFGQQTLPEGEYRRVKEHLYDNFFHIAPEENAQLSTVLEKAAYLVRRHGVKALVVDPYNRLESEQGGQTETLYISEVLDKLGGFAQRTDTLVFLVAHPRKMERGDDGQHRVPSLYDISGSANFFNKADYGLTVHRSKQYETVEIHVQKVKFRHLGTTGVAHFRYNTQNGRYAPCDPADPEFTAARCDGNFLERPPVVPSDEDGGIWIQARYEDPDQLPF